MNNLLFKISDKVKSDFKATLDFWDAARKSDDIGFSKRQWDESDRILNLRGNCAFCEYFELSTSCRHCELNNALGNCYLHGSIFYNWNDALDIYQKKDNAEKIYQFILAWYNKNILNKESAK
jgi:hypothetical protein